MAKGIKAAEEFEDEDDETGDEESLPKAKGKEVRRVVREDPVSQTQLATRVDSTLFRRIKIHCVETNTSIMEFVHSALVAELKKRKSK